MRYPRVHGQAGPRIFNLEDCFRLSYWTGLCREDDVAETVHVNWLLDGAWFDGDEALEAHSGVTELQFLTSWVNNDVLVLEQSSRPDPVFATARLDRWGSAPIDLGNGLEMQLLQTRAVSGDRREEMRLEQQVLCQIRAEEPRDIDEITTRIAHVQDLLTLTSGRTAHVRDLYFTHDDVPEHLLNGDTLEGSHKELRLFTRWANRDDNHAETSSSYAMLFTYDDFGGESGIARWMSTASRYHSELRRIMAAHDNPQMFHEDRVFSLVAALESFDRTRLGKKKTRLATRLSNCVDHAGTPFVEVLGGEDVLAWARRAEGHRHALGHHSDAYRRDMSMVASELADQLVLLGQICLLREAEAPDTVFEKIANSGHLHWVSGRAQAAAAARSRSTRLGTSQT